MLNLNVHEFSKPADGSRPTLTRVTPYICLSRGLPEGGSTRVFIQGGAFYHEGGKEYKRHELPPWLNEELARLTPTALREVGLVDWKPPEGEDEDE
jgi:hypothetical protein